MNKSKLLLAGLLAATVGSTQAATIVHITGSTAFRKATIISIENLMTAGGGFKCAYVAASPSAGGEQGANFAILQGNINGLPAGANPVTIKAHWTGSTGGIQTVVQNILDPSWMADSNLPGTNTIVNVASPANDAPAIADVTMEDSHQASTGFTTTTLTETKVGVIVFEWVANAGSPSTLNNITPLLAQAALSGGMLLSQFTGNSADTDIVYATGRNFDSGTRLSELAESGLSVFAGIQQMQPTTSPAAGGPGSTVTSLNVWPAETVLGIPFGPGQSGYASGGTLANALIATGSNTASGNAPFGGGWLVSYLGRNDSSTACTAPSTAHRLTWNGVADWTGPATGKAGLPGSGQPVIWNDAPVAEGQYSAWEFEWLAYRSNYGTTSANGKAVADAIAAQIIPADAAQSGTTLGAMNVSKPIEGGLITHN
jgi:hypothetical protein